MNTFQVGDRVQHIEDDLDPAVGTVISLPSHGRVLVDFGAYYGRIEYPEDILKLAEPRPFKVGDVVDGIYDVPGHGAVIAEIFDTGHVITTWPNGSRHVEEKRFLKHAKLPKLGAPFPNETRKSDWQLNPPSPFKHDNGGPLKAGPTPIINNTGNSIQVLPMPASDVVNHPTHYTSDKSGVECIEITRHRNFAIGSAIKYLWRAGLKQDPAQSDLAKEIEDLQKSIFYIKDEIARLSKE